MVEELCYDDFKITEHSGASSNIKERVPYQLSG